MEIKDFINRWFYLICGIVILIGIFVFPLWVYDTHNSSTGNFTIQILYFLTYWQQTQTGTSSGIIYDIDSAISNIAGMATTTFIMAIIGAILLILSSILYNKEKIRNILPIIGVGMIMLGVMLYSNWWFCMADEHNAILPFYYFEGTSYYRFAALGIGYYVILGLAGASGVKYLLYNKSE